MLIKLLRASVNLLLFGLTKLGLSLPLSANWHRVWEERGEKVQLAHPELADGRPDHDELRAIEAVIEQLIHGRLLTPGSVWLDVGVGSGKMHAALLGALPNSIFSIACDYSFSSLAFCQRNYGLSVVNCSASQLPFAANSFDFILFYSVSHYLSGNKVFQEVIGEFARVIKPGGAILIGDCLSSRTLRFEHFNPRWFFPGFWRVRRYIRRLGLSVTRLEQPQCAPYREQRFDLLLKKPLI